VTTPSTATQVFFSFPQVTDPRRHRDYNAWHQLDHQPENLALPGVLHGARWVRSPDCRMVGSAEDPLRDVDYLAMYWFAEPAEESIRRWRELGEITRQQGRRPDLRWTQRPLMGMFRPLKGYVNARARVSVDGLPFRPHTGVYVSVTAYEEPLPPEVDARFEWYDQVVAPAMLEVPGVVGGWTFYGQPCAGETTRIALYYLDSDPVEVAVEVAGRATRWSATAPALAVAERTLLSGPLRTIQPWRWDWFDRPDDSLKSME
jgi:hypothetical protein